ncbi:MAG: NAD-dependent succinate-semialdehyde dehydrogenase [Alphaproteobacteria bacterium]
MPASSSNTASITLNDPSLLQTASLIGGAWHDQGANYQVTDPATQQVIAMVSDHGAAEIDAAVAAADKAQAEWAATPAKARGAILRKWAELMLANQADLAMIMTREQGKPLAESMGEIVYAASFIEFYAEEAKRIYGDIIPSPTNDRRLLSIRQPIGIGAGITPWNFPAAMITRKAAPAIAAGCAMVIKPAEGTPLSALALGELANRAGLPAGILNIVTGSNPAPIGARMCEHDRIKAISFTGSTAVGKKLLQDMAGTVKKASMELGGNAPFIVFDDADIDAAVDGAMMSKYRNAGQTCVCANRIFVQDGIYDQFMDRFRAKIAALKLGNGLDQGTTIGPLINQKAFEKVSQLVNDALSAGAKSTIGSHGNDLGGNNLGGSFYTPTLLEGVTSDMDITRNEIFGPVAPVIRFKDEASVIEQANDTPFGLAAYFYSKDLARSWRVSEKLEYGIVGVNCGIVANEVAPFGGMKQSGLGREGSRMGIDEWVEVKYIAMAGL